MNTINHRYRLHLNNYFKFISDVYSHKTRQTKTQQFVSPKASSNSDAKILKTTVFSGEVKPISSDSLNFRTRHRAYINHVSALNVLKLIFRTIDLYLLL